MSIFDLLKQDHRKVESLLDEIIDHPTAHQKQQKLFQTFCKEIKAHNQGEDATFYEALKQHKKIKDIILKADEEHHAAETIIEQLEKDDLPAEKWNAKIKVLRDMILNHVKSEEKEIFSLAKKYLEKDDLKSIQEQFQNEKENYM
ncbi:MAG: hemerythrin domain-containing protein [Alphaproteobacteria bacterium]|nr:hemerythrin domain-containing protein [Alphaproteobacteria bacterium]